jgi:hypothetical protein
MTTNKLPKLVYIIYSSNIGQRQWFHRTSWSSGLHSCFVFGRSRVKISSQTPAILTEAFRGFTEYLKANAEITP